MQIKIATRPTANPIRRLKLSMVRPQIDTPLTLMIDWLNPCLPSDMKATSTKETAAKDKMLESTQMDRAKRCGTSSETAPPRNGIRIPPMRTAIMRIRFQPVRKRRREARR
jgi:hypothetical protein